MADTSGWPNEGLMNTEFVYFVSWVFGIFFVSASYVSCIFITSWILGFSWLVHSFLSTFNKLMFFLLPMFTWHILQVASILFGFFLLQHNFVISARQHITSTLQVTQNIQFFHSNVSYRCVIIVHHYYSKQYGNSIF